MKKGIKITFVGAGSTIFLKNIIGDSLLFDSLSSAELALYDIDSERLQESKLVIESLNQSINGGRAAVKTYLGVENRKEALRGATFVINAIQVGGYKPATVADFEIPEKYGLRQTIGDTLGIGGLFRGLRTIPVMLDIADEMMSVCPDALLLNYTNPMAIVTGAILKATEVRAVGLCHSVQVCATELLKSLDIKADDLYWEIAGINHMAWLLKITDGGKDLYPEIKKRAAEKNRGRHPDMVRFEMMKYFGYYITESSEHFAEYTPYWIRDDSPELIEKFNIPLNEYPRRCVKQIEDWKERKKDLVSGKILHHEKTREYGADIMNAVVTDTPYRIHGNILNTDALIPNLQREAVVEVPCYADASGIRGVKVDPLPVQCAALNQTNINMQLLSIHAALTGSRDAVYQAALLDPHTSAALPPEKIFSLCDELLEVHKQWLPEYR